MGRVKLTEAVLGRQQSGVAVLLDGASVQVNDSAGDPATVYEEAVGGTPLSNPLTSDDGRLPGFVDEGYYELVVTYDGDTADPVPFEARAAYPSGGTTGQVLAVASGGGVEWVDANSVLGSAPWRVFIDVFGPPSTQTNWTTISQSSTNLYGGRRVSSGAQNDEVGWDVVLGAGTWTISLISNKDTSFGIYTVSLDGVSVGTLDAYAAGPASNEALTITGVDVATTGRKRLLLKMATKNVSASQYFGAISAVTLVRTA